MNAIPIQEFINLGNNPRINLGAQLVLATPAEGGYVADANFMLPCQVPPGLVDEFRTDMLQAPHIRFFLDDYFEDFDEQDMQAQVNRSSILRKMFLEMIGLVRTQFANSHQIAVLSNGDEELAFTERMRMSIDHFKSRRRDENAGVINSLIEVASERSAAKEVQRKKEVADLNNYCIVSDSSPLKLVEQVNARMGKGWLPQGGGFTSPETDPADGMTKTYFHQAMTRPLAMEEVPPPEPSMEEYLSIDDPDERRRIAKVLDKALKDAGVSVDEISMTMMPYASIR